MNELKKITECFYVLCNKYQELTKEYNLINSDNQRNEYFKYQFPNSYDKLMYAFTLVPSFDKLTELAKWFKVKESGNCELVEALVTDGVDVIYEDAEYVEIYTSFAKLINQVYASTDIVKDYKLEYLYLYQKLLAESNIDENLKKNILDHIIYLMSINTKYTPLVKPTEELQKELEKYNTLPAYNEDEPDKYYQLIYNTKDINLGGCDLDYIECPLHKLQPNNKNIGVQNISDINNIQISRGSNKKLLSDKNNFKVQYFHNNSYNNIMKKYFTIGDKMTEEDIKNEMKKIIDKYSKNGTFDVELMSKTLCDKILNIYTNLPSASSLDMFKYLDSSGVNKVVNPHVLFAFDKEIDDIYFEGKISYFANCCLALSQDSYMNINDPVCSEYIFTIKQLNALSYVTYKYEIYAAYYLMINYLLEKYTKWFNSIKSKLGIDEKGIYHREKDTVRAKAVSNGYEEKYDKYMKINYLRLFTSEISQEYEEYYNIFKTFSVCFEKYLSLSLALYSDIENLVIKDTTKNTTIREILSEIRTNKQSYSNNIFLKNYGFRYYFNEMLKDITSATSKITYNSLIANLEKIYPSRISEYFTNDGIESMFNDVTYYYLFKQNHCNKCYENVLDFIVSGFYDIFKEINIYKQYHINNSSTNTKLIYDILTPEHFVDEDTEITYDYKLNYTLSTFDYNSVYLYDKNKTNYLEKCYLTDGSKAVIYENEKYVKININDRYGVSKSPGTYTVATKYNNYFAVGCKFKSDSEFIKNTIIYKTLIKNTYNIEKDKPFLITGNNYQAVNIIKNGKVYTYNDSPSINMNGILYHDNSVNISDQSSTINTILYTENLNNNYISKYSVKGDENYLYQIEDEEKLKKILAECSTSDFIISTNIYELKCKSKEIVSIEENNYTTLKVGKNVSEAQQLLDENYKLLSTFDNSKTNIEVMYENNNLSNTIPVIHREGDIVFYNGDTQGNDGGYTLIKNKENNEYIALVITNINRFRCIDGDPNYNRNNIFKSLNQLSFYYDYNDTQEGKLKSLPVDISNLSLKDSYIIINKKQISDIQGTKLNEDLLIYCNNYYINNANIKILEKDIYKINTESNTLQKEFFVKEFNKLMLRKCFPNNFKRTLIINQDVLDAIDGGKYSVPNIKIKEALYEYGKYPYYLEHYFITNRIDYKLKGKFNIRCLANLSTLPDVTKYLDINELNYQIKEVLIQGEDMIIKDGKIQSSGDVYLVGIELSNDHMFRVPASKITNKGLLNVIDFQQFDNIYDRVELYLDDTKLTDYIVKPLTLENIGTLKNMKYINFY